ncbi:MAG: hypothetical protein H0W19_07225 [Nitrosopumilus sp.]|nr:hypothetical protein [Nitrosopumilus sp.]
MIFQTRNRTRPEDVIYAIHLYFDGLSLRNTSKALSRFFKRSHSAFRDWIQKYKPGKLFYQKICFQFSPLCWALALDADLSDNGILIGSSAGVVAPGL